MTPAAAGWLEDFCEFVARYRSGRPLDAVVASERLGQRPILATHLATWAHGEGAALPATHAIVVTTSDTGIAVVDEFLGGGGPLAEYLRPRMRAVREIEYRLWTKDHPDPERERHVNHWSWIKAPVPLQRSAEFSAWPLQSGEVYWLHRTGTSGPGKADRRHAHLWKWNGRNAVLLKPFIQERVEAL